MTICVYGAANENISKSYIEAGEELGRLMAKRGHRLVYGAGATGLMGAVSRGVAEAGGYVTGIVPTFFTNEEVLNKKCDEIIRTETMRQRKQFMEDRADAFIITVGGIGTYDEWFEMLTLKQLGRHKKPIVILNTDGFYDKMLEAIEFAVKEKVIKRGVYNKFKVVSTPDEALSYIEEVLNA